MDLYINSYGTYLHKRSSKANEIEKIIDEIRQYIIKITDVNGTIDEKRNTIQGYEGNASNPNYACKI